jgi:hypothetical protein
MRGGYPIRTSCGGTEKSMLAVLAVACHLSDFRKVKPAIGSFHHIV